MAEAAYQANEFPHIVRRDTYIGMQAILMGTGLKVWQIESVSRSVGSSAEVAEYYKIDVALIEEALAYARCHPDEIDEAISDNASYDLDKLRRCIPSIRVFEARDDEEPA